jgi:hypothetical protein
VAGTNASSSDPSNDPAHVAEWSHDRDIRADLIRWLAVDDRASARVDPAGVRVLGARIIGGFDLSYVHVPFAIMARKCAIAETIHMVRTEIPNLDLDGSYIDEFDGKGLVVHGDLNMGKGFHSSGEVRIETAKIDGDLNLGGGHLHHSKVEMTAELAPFKMALDAFSAVVGGATKICCGFESDGAVTLTSSSLHQGLLMWGAHLSNPNNVALQAGWADIGSVELGGFAPGLGGFEAVGRVDFDLARVKYVFQMVHARFRGAVSESPAISDLMTGHGLFAGGMTVDGPLVLTDVRFENGAVLNLTGVKVGGLVDEEKSWPDPGRLLIEGFTYQGFLASADADSRLRWIGLQPEFHSQPYRYLAKVLRENGDNAGAIEVLVAQEDARFRNSSWLGRAWARFLRITVGYGHEPLRTVLWSLAVIVLGWLMVVVGARAGVMRATWPDSPPPSEPAGYESLHPLLYSLDVFLPFVNLHQERYWWPDANAHGDCVVLNRHLKMSGAFLRYYLWTQVIAGWLLSAIFVAGVTGLMKSD